MRHHILLPTDFSDNSWSAISYALKLYADEACTFYFLHAWTFSNPSSRTYITSTFINIQQEETKEKLSALKGKAQGKSSNTEHEFETIFSTQPLIRSIEKALNDFPISLAIMGTKGATGAKEFIFGSNTVNVINKIRVCPVLVVPDAYTYAKPKQIAFPTDFNHFYGDELLPLMHLTKLHDAKIRVVHITEKDHLTEKQNYNLSMLKANLEDYPSSLEWRPNFGTKELIIKEFIQEFDINIVAMVNYKHSLIESILNEPVIQKIGYHPVIPFLVMPELNA